MESLMVAAPPGSCIASHTTQPTAWDINKSLCTNSGSVVRHSGAPEDFVPIRYHCNCTKRTRFKCVVLTHTHLIKEVKQAATNVLHK